MGLCARPRRFISIAAAVITAVLPAPTQCASRVLSFWSIRQTASFWCLSRSLLPQHRAVHARKRQVRAVIGAQAEIVERVVVKRASRCARSSSCHIHSLNRSLSFCCASRAAMRLLLVDDARVLVDLVVNRGRASVERVLDQVGCQRPRRAPGRRVADAGFRGSCRASAPRWRWRRNG